MQPIVPMVPGQQSFPVVPVNPGGPVPIRPAPMQRYPAPAVARGSIGAGASVASSHGDGNPANQTWPGFQAAPVYGVSGSVPPVSSVNPQHESGNLSWSQLPTTSMSTTTQLGMFYITIGMAYYS